MLPTPMPDDMTTSNDVHITGRLEASDDAAALATCREVLLELDKVVDKLRAENAELKTQLAWLTPTHEP
jgi:hypothetical protein